MHTRAFSISSFTTDFKSTMTCPLAILAMSLSLIRFSELLILARRGFAEE